MTENIPQVYFSTDKYEVIECDDVLGEDGKYGQLGYAVRNKETAVTEHTTMMLPGAIFQCQHFTDTLKSLLAEDTAPELAAVEDIVPADADLN